MQYAVGSRQFKKRSFVSFMDGGSPFLPACMQGRGLGGGVGGRQALVFRLLLLVVFGSFISWKSFTQDSLLLTKNFQFENGIYLSLESFQANRPDYQWKEVEANLFVNPQTFLATVEFINLKKDADTLPLDMREIWILSIGGIPYIRLSEGATQKEPALFVALKLRGKICYFHYPDSEIVRFPMSAYNPLNGKPFRTAVIERKRDVTVEKILNFKTGEIADFTVENFLKWIGDDKRLVQTIRDLSPKKAKEKLFKCLLIYDDRNVVYLPERDHQKQKTNNE